MFGLVGTSITQAKLIAAAVVAGVLLAALPVTYFKGRISGKAKCEAAAKKSSDQADDRSDGVADKLDGVGDNTKPILDQGRDNQNLMIEGVRQENHLLRVEIDRLKREAQNEDTSDWDSGDLPTSVRVKWDGINQQVFGSGGEPMPRGERLAGGNARTPPRDAASPEK